MGMYRTAFSGRGGHWSCWFEDGGVVERKTRFVVVDAIGVVTWSCGLEATGIHHA